MTIAFRKGRYSARLADGQADVLTCQQLRHLCFFGEAGVDADAFDAICDHMMVFDAQSGQLVCTFRILHLETGHEIHRSYAAQSYDLAGLSELKHPLVEIGRFCCDPAILSPDVLRVAWAALAQIVDAAGAKLLFGCSSFAGTDPARYSAAFGTLAQRHLGPDHQRPKRHAPETVSLGDYPNDPRTGVAQMPPLLKTYLGMGGWVSDHAVIDREMNTLHVFTGLFTTDVPPARARALRAMAQTP